MNRFYHELTFMAMRCSLFCIFLIGMNQALHAQPEPISRLSQYVQQYRADKNSLNRKYILKANPQYYARMEQLYDRWMEKLSQVEYGELSVQEAADFILLRRNIQRDLRENGEAESSYNEIQPVIPFQPVIRDIREKRKVGTDLDGKELARQLINPFFLGGTNIIISYPTNTMSQDDKMMSMRGNNPNFSKATVHHELIAGHHLQFYYQDRYHPYRRAFSTPFWTEGWALYWELRLWDLGFPETPEERIGMLFWRVHRCARIIFSLKYHLAEMSPQEAIDFLVEKVGHEYANAEAEVRRSFAATYPPLYQAAYLLGGLQIESMHNELVINGSMPEKEFHDSFLKNGSMPIEMMRYVLKDQKPPKDSSTDWRFHEDL